MELQFNPIWPWPIVAIVAVLLLVFSHWTYRRGTPARRRLLTLRWLTIGLSLFAVLRPNLVFTKKTKQSSTLVVLADKSKSMLLRDMWDNQSRWEAMKRLWQESDPALKELGEDVQIRTFDFSKTLSENIAWGSDPAGEQTAVGDAIEDILNRTSGERLAGIILLSDGANTTGLSPAAVARQLSGQNVPVYAFGFGRETATEQVRDIAARNILTGSTTFVKNKLVARAEFQAAGFAHQSLNVKLLFNGVETTRGTTKIGPTGSGVIELEGIPETPGELKVTMEADVQPGELLPGNNLASTFVTVRPGGIRVVQIEGKYRYWEPKFLRWALDQSPDIELNQLYLLDTSGSETTVPPELFDKGRFDVYILGDVASSRFSSEEIGRLTQIVEKGAGLLMMGGYESFGPGGWGRTRIADILPVTMGPADSQRKEALKFIPTAAGLRHFVLRLAGDDKANQDLWGSLRPLDGGSSVTGLKSNALVLAQTPEGVPLLAAQEVGAGRSIAFVGDTTWRWRKDNKGIAAHARFWRQLILWLAHHDEIGGNEILARLPYRRLSLGQKLPIEVQVLGEGGKPITNAQVQATVKSPSGADIPVPLTVQGDQYQASFWQTDTAGDYTLQIAATAGGRTIGSKSLKFLVHAEDREMLQLAADLPALRNLAGATSGEFHPAEELPTFLKTLKQKDLNLEVAQSVRESLWDRTPLLLVFVVLLGAEWIIRKRNGLA